MRDRLGSKGVPLVKKKRKNFGQIFKEQLPERSLPNHFSPGSRCPLLNTCDVLGTGEESWWSSLAFFTGEGTEVNLGNSSLMEARLGESEETNLKIVFPVCVRGTHLDGAVPVTRGCVGQLGEQDGLNSCNLFFLLGLRVPESL